ncbi:HK97 family phage prohead protease [Blautia sp. MSK.20.85]|nr:HK97 family phage prohead protease [Blautia sp. MSK.20.85]
MEIREQSVTIDGYVNAVARDSRPIRDRRGEQFIEQIVPGAFERAISRADEIKILLNHDYSRELGSTKTNLQLFEDNIGLRAIAEITDAEVIEKAKKGELRGWSFGFIERAAKEEDTDSGLKRRFVEDMDLKEVSIIDNRKIPCYASTSIEMRADGNEVLEVRTLETKVISSEQKEKVDYSKYEATIRRLGGKS